MGSSARLNDATGGRDNGLRTSTQQARSTWSKGSLQRDSGGTERGKRGGPQRESHNEKMKNVTLIVAKFKKGTCVTFTLFTCAFYFLICVFLNLNMCFNAN